MRGTYGLNFASGSPVTVPGGAAGPAEEESRRPLNSLISQIFPGRGGGGFYSELSWRNFILLRMEKPGVSLGISVR